MAQNYPYPSNQKDIYPEKLSKSYTTLLFQIQSLLTEDYYFLLFEISLLWLLRSYTFVQCSSVNDSFLPCNSL